MERESEADVSKTTSGPCRTMKGDVKMHQFSGNRRLRARVNRGLEKDHFVWWSKSLALFSDNRVVKMLWLLSLLLKSKKSIIIESMGNSNKNEMRKCLQSIQGAVLSKPCYLLPHILMKHRSDAILTILRTPPSKCFNNCHSPTFILFSSSFWTTWKLVAFDDPLNTSLWFGFWSCFCFLGRVSCLPG